MVTETLVKKTKQKMEKNIISGSKAVILSLIEEGIDTIFGYVGGAIMPIYDALYDYQDKINHVLVRHEQGAVHAAQAYARVKRKPGVCFATSGPGATNLITGIADAHLDSTPLVCITGQVNSQLLGTDAFQETDIIGISMPITKWNYQVTKADEIPEVLAKAFYIANTGRPGPVLIDITKDAQFGELDYHYKACSKVRSYLPFPKLQLDKVQQAAKLINNSKKPFLLAGHGILISEAQEEFKAFVEKTGIPVGCTLLGLSSFPSDHELNVGMLGMHGNYAPNLLTNESDLIIAVGMRFDDRVTGNVKTYAPKAKIIHIEIDPSEVDKNVKCDIPILADAKEALSALLPMVKKSEHKLWLDEFKKLYKKEYDTIISRQIFPQNGTVQMGEVIRLISEKTKGDAIIVSDVGQHQMKTGRYYKFLNPGSFITSGGLGTMGFGLPAAIGAKIANNKKEVIAVIGDGGFQMTLQELGTIFQYKIPVKVVILNNNFLGMVRQWQQLFFNKRYSFTELINPDFVAIVKGFDIKAQKVSKRPELEEALENMLASKEAYVLDIMVEKEENVFPMVPSGDSISNIRLE